MWTISELVRHVNLDPSMIHKFSLLKNVKISKETKICGHSRKQRTKISITAQFEEEIL
jgi:hypothetical protein